MAQIGKYTVMLIIAVALSIFAHWVNSDYLTVFFAQNAILLGVTIFTIHTAAAVGVLMSQLEILRNKTNGDFTSTIRGIKNSFFEAIILLFLIMVVAIALTTKAKCISPLSVIPFHDILLPALLVLCVIGLIDIVRDTANAILMCLEPPE